MSVLETKSLLAKLLAEENITVQHRKTQTAYFDVKQRILVCPILKDMPDELYDLLMGHEVGHALFTPPDGWHDAVVGNQLPGFKSFLNIVEDARIERFVKNRFPGIRSSFYYGYKDLFERDFFGVKDYPVEKLKLIDKINLHFKLGTLFPIEFTDEELVYVSMVDGTKTWEDVVEVAKTLYEHAKEEAKTDTHKDSNNSEFGEDEDQEDGDGFQFNNENGEWDDLLEELNEELQNESEFIEDYDPEAVTDKEFRRREKDLVDETCIPISYVNLPQFNLANRIIPFKTVYKDMEDSGLSDNFEWVVERFGCSVKKFNEKNGRYVNYLVKEFELRKNAKQFARASINKTGELDMKKISKYQLTEDLFRRVTVVPQGKSHGLVIFLDLSGSMKPNMAGTIEQLLILTMFCRKVNIPFAVYGFSDNKYGKETVTANSLADYKVNDIHFQNNFFKLKEYLTSNMSRLEFNDAILKLLVLGEMFKAGLTSLPLSEYLNGTPIDEAIVASIDIMNKFRKEHKVEVLTAMFLTDGDANASPRYFVDSVETNAEGKKVYTQSAFRSQSGSYAYKFNLVITDPKSRASVSANSDDYVMTSLLLSLAKKATNANYVGFYIGSPGDTIGLSVRKVFDIYRVKSDAHQKDLVKARKEKFYPIYGTGFDVYYVIPGGDELEVKGSGLSVGQDANKNQLKKAFLQAMSSRAVNRIFLSRFCNTLCENV